MFRVALLVACGLLAACTVERDGMPAGSGAVRAEVELDIFSGRPNPTWILTDAETESVVERLDGAPRLSATDMPGHLGYRGFVVRVTQGSDTRVTRIPANSGDRELERWLLNTGKPHLANELFQVVDRELRGM
jgi:hypothetical protein